MRIIKTIKHTFSDYDLGVSCPHCQSQGVIPYNGNDFHILQVVILICWHCQCEFQKVINPVII